MMPKNVAYEGNRLKGGERKLDEEVKVGDIPLEG